MADHGHHDPGGHELEAINTKMLFRLFIALTLVTLLASIAVVQWFYSQRRELEAGYAAEGSFQLIDYKTKMGADLEGIESVTQAMVANPTLVQAPPPPPGWTHPDDLVGGAVGEPAPVPERARPEPVEPLPDEPMPNPEIGGSGQDEPTQDEPTQDEPSNDTGYPEPQRPAEAADGE